MSGVAAIRYMLVNNAPLIASVPAARILSGVLPITTTIPAISVRQISGVEMPMIKRTGTQLVTERIQVSVHASSYLSQKTIIELIRSAITSTRGTVNSVVVDSITHEGDGPDLYSDDPDIYEQSIDFMVIFYR
ncbi:MAG: hypothetical protein IPI17_17795 [Nitrosomonas sp.]|jgi:hypothetical protein|nr:hypothetical protein [Nitrosomonas sp.]